MNVCPKCYEKVRDCECRLAVAKQRLAAEITDKQRIDCLEASVRPIEIHGGAEDGHVGKLWAISAHGGTVREALDSLIAHQAAAKP